MCLCVCVPLCLFLCVCGCLCVVYLLVGMKLIILLKIDNEKAKFCYLKN